ncbi:MAG: hypothetical protein K2Q18_13135, partial [Bdellovibrionales bacterium]|nr:hypothetical protein [Bdellovibrionales bacterium]
MLENIVTQLSLIAYSLVVTMFISPLTYGSIEISDEPLVVSADRIKSPLETSPSDIKVFYKEEIEKSNSITELLNKESDLKLVQ